VVYLDVGYNPCGETKHNTDRCSAMYSAGRAEQELSANFVIRSNGIIAESAKALEVSR
jgi:hypothetical protein